MAQIGAAHGLKGEVRLRSFTGDLHAFAQYGSLQTEDGARQLEIESQRAAKDDFIVRFRGVSDRDAAEALRNVNLYVEREKLPPPDDGEFYHADLIGLRAVSASGEALGEVIAIHNFGAGDIVQLKLTDGATTMLAFDETTVPKVDIAGGQIVVQMPAEIVAVDETNPDSSPPPLRGRSATKRPGGR